MKIGGHDIGRRVFIIAEIGNNHEGDLDIAKEMIRLAADSGADAVKFQTIVPEQLVAPSEKERLALLNRFRFTPEQFEQLSDTTRASGVIFLSTPFDITSVGKLDSLVPAFKISSGDNNFPALLIAVAATGKPVLLSSGMTDINEIVRTKKIVELEWRKRGLAPGLALLHCVSAYPTPDSQANLLAIRTLRGVHEIVGYSDHTLGIEAAVLSVALGARIVEKHFTISKKCSEFRDHQLSADPAEFKTLVQRIRAAETLIGDGRKMIMEGERATSEAARRSIAAASDLAAGHVINLEDITWLRPADGLPPGSEGELLGRRLKRNVGYGDRLTVDLVR